MYLKSLEINGFKSFSQKTVLSFNPPKDGTQSITAIVGPNGSGKSNVADAMRWVMGEQSMKVLRAKRNDDLIFAGSEAKGKMSVAYVTLVIDNSDGKLPIDYEELVLTRRAYRTGENEYFINSNQVRLIDLQLLLAKAQFGQGSYSVIGQGMIDKMLLQTPSERKDFFDEAFGIKEFQIKRHQAILKLTRTKENIMQADTLLAEVSPRLKNLSRQVKKLEQKQEIETALREMQEAYYSTIWLHNEENLSVLKNELALIDKQYKTLNDELLAIQNKLGGLARESSREDVYNELQNNYQDLLQRKNKLEKDRAELAGKMQVEYSKAGKHNIGWLESKISSLKEENDRMQRKLEESQKNLHTLREKEKQKKSDLDKITIERAELRGKMASLESSFLQAKSEQNFIQSAGLKAVQAVLENKNKFGEIYGALAQLGEVEKKFQLALDVAAGSNLSSLVVANDNVAEECIRFLRSEHLGVATFLPLNKIKPRFVPGNIQEFLSMPGVYGLAIDLIKFSDKFEDVFSFVFGSTLIVEDIESARNIGIGRVRMVTLEGDVMEVTGSMKGGYRRQKSIGLSFANGKIGAFGVEDPANQTKRMEQTKMELTDSEGMYERLQHEMLEIKGLLQVEDKKQEFLREQKQDIGRELASMEQERSLQTMSEEEYGNAMKDLSVNKDMIDKDINILDGEINIARGKIENFHQEEEKKKQMIFALQDAMQEAQNNLNAIVNQKNEKQIAVARLDTKQEDLINEVYQEMRASVESILKREGPQIALENIDAAMSEIQKLKYKLTLVGGIEEGVYEEYQQTLARHEGLVTQLDDLKKALDDLENMVEELDGIMKKRRDKSFKKIKQEFQRYFEILFDGGKAELNELIGDEEKPEEAAEESVFNQAQQVNENVEMIDGDVEREKPKRKKKILQGIEITACPPGKKINDLQALSGGERTLTSIALICAILHVNPPPFSVLDEVEAALDEANTLRFNKILYELAKQSQFILITHNRATMHAADILYGVTMGGQGVSNLLSVKMSDVKE